MKEKYNKNMSMKLMELLDGELAKEMEPGVFDALGRDEDLQSEFQDHLAIREAVRRDVAAFTPPPELAASLFKRVGLTHPSAIISPRKFTWKRYSALLLLLLLGGSSMALLNKLGNTDKSTVVNPAGKEANCSSGAIVDNSFETEKGFSKISDSKINKLAGKIGAISPITKKSFASNASSVLLINDAASQSSNLSAGNVASVAPIEAIRTEYAMAGNSVYRFASNDNSLALYNYSPLKTLQNARNSISLSEFRFGDNGSAYAGSVWSLRLRGIYALSAAEKQLQSGSLKTFSIGVFTSLKVDDNLSLGMEYGVEPFSQVFTNSKDASGVQYDQQPTLSWIAISARYEAGQFAIAGFTPAAQISFAGSELGPIVKAYAGVSYPVYNAVGINFGVESSSLFYKNQGVFNSTQKFGLTGGVCIKL